MFKKSNQFPFIHAQTNFQMNMINGKETPFSIGNWKSWKLPLNWKAQKINLLVLLLMLIWLAILLALFVERDNQANKWFSQEKTAFLLVDEQGAQSFAEIHDLFESGKGQPIKVGQLQTFDNQKVHWLELHLPQVTQEKDMVLTLPFPSLSKVSFYWQDEFRGWKNASAGTRVAVDHWRLPYLYPAFDFSLEPNKPQKVYLRIEHARPLTLVWQLWERDHFSNNSQMWHMLLGGYMGFMTLAICICCLSTAMSRDTIPLHYAISEILVALALMTLLGMGGELLWPSFAKWNEYSNLMLPIWAVSAMVFFQNRLMKEDMPNWVSYTQWFLVLLGVVLPALVIWGINVLYWGAVAYFLVAFPLALALVAWFAFLQPVVGRWLLLGTVALTAGTLLPTLLGLGRIPFLQFSQHALLLGVFLGMLLILTSIYMRSRLQRDQQIRKNTLLREDPLTGLTREWLVLERIEHLIQRQYRSPGIGAVMRIRVTNLGKIYQEDGPQLAEAASIHAGRCIGQQGRRSGDTLGRVSNGDFVLILDGDLKPEFVQRGAQRIIASGLSFSPWLPTGMTLKLRIAFSAGLYPDCDAKTLVKKLSDLLDEMDEQGSGQGKAIQMLRLTENQATAETIIPSDADLSPK